MRHRLYAALALALALALLIATGSFVRSSQHVVGTSSPSPSASLTFLDDDREDAAVTATPQFLVGLFVGLSVVALVVAPPAGADASGARRARAPPAR